jgi:hypothetical protein
VNQKLEQLKSVTTALVDPNKPMYTLRPEVLELISILENSQNIQATHHVETTGIDTTDIDIADGETRTSNGLALSPTMAAMCAKDYVRTIAFIRGTHAAIVDIRHRFPDRPAHILYAGCGPFATLAVPLMSLFSSLEAKFTLLDIHTDSIISAKSIIETLSLSQSVASFETLDASSYHLNTKQEPDIILIEVMQACLASEPQVAVTRHLMSQTSSALLIPEDVSIKLILVDTSKEFNVNSTAPNGEVTKRDRIPLASVFVLNRETVELWKYNSSNQLPGALVHIPESVEKRYQPMLFTEITVYQNHQLKDYASGLTCPKTLSSISKFKADDDIQFYYELGQCPQLKAQVGV